MAEAEERQKEAKVFVTESRNELRMVNPALSEVQFEH